MIHKDFGPAPTVQTARHTLARKLGISPDELRFDGIPYQVGETWYAATETGYATWPASPEASIVEPSGPVLFELPPGWNVAVEFCADCKLSILPSELIDDGRPLQLQDGSAYAVRLDSPAVGIHKTADGAVTEWVHDRSYGLSYVQKLRLAELRKQPWPEPGPIDEEAQAAALEAEIAQACEGLPPFRFAYFEHNQDVIPKPKSGTWAQFMGQLTEPAIRPDKNGPNFAPALLDPPYREDRNVMAITALVLDLDGKDGPVSRAAFEAVLTEYTFFAYTSFQHDPGAQRWRIVLPLTLPAPPKEHQAMFEWAKEKLGGMLDTSCSNPSRFYYLPVCPEGRREHYQWCIRRGRTLDPDDFAVAAEDGNKAHTHAQ